MSTGKSNHLPPPVSNEKIIEEIVADVGDLETNCDGQGEPTVEKQEDSSSECPVQPTSEYQAEEAPSLEAVNAESDEENEFDESNKNLLESSMSDEEKEVLRDKAVAKKNEGNELYKAENYLDALQAYTDGLQICPLQFTKERSIIYSNRAATKIKLGRDKSALCDCDKAIELDPQYLRALVRRATLKEEMKQLDESLADWKLVLELNPAHPQALAAARRLPSKIEARNEELKAEMLGEFSIYNAEKSKDIAGVMHKKYSSEDKLKSLGNMVLRPFGLSTENFKMVPNGEGGYSVQFEQSKPNV
ncbi:hypothetical protein B566_EDAN009000 [Ephemera danica]|nr:hypothetical protein B566_EDAN009000 [Ephemera danica]